MNKSTLGILAVTVVVVGGGGGCIIKQVLQNPPASQQERAAVPPPAVEPAPTPAPTAPSEAAPSPATTTPDVSAREGSTPSVSEIVVTKNKDSVAPTNASPEANMVFSADAALKPITFRWTPLVPKPKEPVTYRLKVWQLMEGQNGTSAMKTNTAIVSKDVGTQSETSVSGIYTGPCKPPYLCDFVWGVEAMSGGVSGGMSDATTFSVAAEATSAPSDSGAADGTR